MERRGAAGQGAMLVTPRQLEALIRLSEARARAELRRLVTKADVEDVLELMKNGLNFQEPILKLICLGLGIWIFYYSFLFLLLIEIGFLSTDWCKL